MVTNPNPKQIVILLAAQVLVRRSLANAASTFATNPIGTLNLLDALRDQQNPSTILLVTSDNTYANDGYGPPMREGAALATTNGIKAEPVPGPADTSKLALRGGLVRSMLNWCNRLVRQETFAATADWYRRCQNGAGMSRATLTRIAAYQSRSEVCQ